MKSMRLLIVIFFCVLHIAHARATDDAHEIFLRANAAYKQGDFLAALTDYNLIKNPGNAVWYNQSKAFNRVGDSPMAKVCEMRAMKDSSFLSTAALQVLVIFFWYSMCLIGALYFWYFIFSMRLVILLLLFLGSINSLVSFTLYRRYKEQKMVHGVTNSQVTLYAGPDNHYHPMGQCDSATVVTVIKEVPLWYQVRVKKGLCGWVNHQALIIV